MTMVEERWVTIPGFERYEISDLGNIYNTRYRQPMRISRSQHGHTKITLTAEDGSRHDRSVAKLVAEAFVAAPNRNCDHLMILDGDLGNVAAYNLAWRPRSFAWSYTHQLRVPQPIHYHNLRVLNVTQQIEYKSIIEAGMAEGLLFDDIWRSTYMGSRVYPYGFVYEIV